MFMSGQPPTRVRACAPVLLCVGEQEAGLAWRGVVAALPAAATAAAGPGGGPPQLLVVDMGGRSTEIIHGAAGREGRMGGRGGRMGAEGSWTGGRLA